ncbi:hypothetical protein J1N35_011702 [Gossypium stocksii]|uniref:Uncharacterized protein n=1 Tax=Gossypium stocksii TaxID=47602 RepID=A0A9D3W2I1_9ROSI|nr:hypothetical protein J1N35_011702 [Gossypium stocksii]
MPDVQESPEDAAHLLWYFNTLRQLWSALNLPIDITRSTSECKHQIGKNFPSRSYWDLFKGANDECHGFGLKKHLLLLNESWWRIGLAGSVISEEPLSFEFWRRFF